MMTVKEARDRAYKMITAVISSDRLSHETLGDLLIEFEREIRIKAGEIV